MKAVGKGGKNRRVAITLPSPLCSAFHPRPRSPSCVLLQRHFVLYYALTVPLINKKLCFIHFFRGLCQQQLQSFVCELCLTAGLEMLLCWDLTEGYLCVCICVFSSAAAGVSGQALGWCRIRQAHHQTVQDHGVSGVPWRGVWCEPGNSKCWIWCGSVVLWLFAQIGSQPCNGSMNLVVNKWMLTVLITSCECQEHHLFTKV